MKCEPQLQEQHAVKILLKNIHGPIAFLLKGFTIKTFEKLLNKASNLQEEAPRMPFLREQSEDTKGPKLVKTFEKKAMVSAVDKGKRPVVSQPCTPPPPQPPQKQSFQIVSKHTRDPAFIPFRERLLPEARRPEDESKKEDPKYCPYHRMLSHPLEDCIVFNDWLERNYIQGFESVIPKVDYNVLAHLRKLPAKLSIYESLLLSKEMRESLIKALLDPEICLAQLASTSKDEALYFKEVSGVTFSDEDLLLGTTDHNRPLYIIVDVENFKLSRDLVDMGASVNVMNIKTLIYLRADSSKLSTDNLVLPWFNEKGERAFGSITLLLEIGELKTEAKFYITDLATSFNALLGRPWINEYRMAPSTLHQCVKYQRECIEHVIKVDLQPFSIQEIGIYEDAKYFIPKGSSSRSKFEIKIEEKLVGQKSNQEKEKEKEKDEIIH
ncbi:uncharacterized protein LOC110106707 [Dendrobium catenatum]|uniref:uncharacterized protein LOC110106707 n=1 Tax=Dendrobium catenatum TaxID=906689 RepID=UPI0010A05EB8|nr:uncharacterized protein LOC110106707 [Dendrobium catenatum]